MDDIDSCLPGGQAPSHWYDTWDRQSCQSFSSTAKGLRNAPGENNCFLNSAVQVFWHIDVFRRSYRRLSGHLCMGNSCIFCALKVIFTQFQYSDQSSLQPSALRQALANTFAKQERFQLGHMDDAAECFENILHRIHYHIANTYNEDTCNAPHCIPHQKFAMTVADQLVCPCGSSSEPLKFHEMVHYISANALVSQSRTMQESGDTLHPNRFGLLLRNAGAVGNVRDCPGNCGKRVQIRRTLLNVPDVVSIGLVWGSDRPDLELTTEVAKTIGTTLLLPDIFHSVMCNDVSTLPRLHLSSMVCYYGKHYSTFVWHTKLNSWVYFDDATVKEIGTRWEDVVQKIVRSRYQPLLLIYSNPAAVPVTTETAPNTRVMAPGYSLTPGKGAQESEKKGPVGSVVTETGRSQGIQRSQTPNFENRDIKKPEEQVIGTKETLGRTSSFENRRQSSFLIAMTSKSRGKGQEGVYQVPHNNKLIESPRDAISNEHNVQSNVVNENKQSVDSIPEDGQDYTDSYNYTLSNNDQYRRPGLSSPDPNKLPLTLNFSRNNEMQRKESLKKGKGKVPADVIRYQMDPSRRPSLDSDQGSPVINEGSNKETVSPNKPALPAKPVTHVRTRSQSLEDNLVVAPDTASNPHTVVKPKPSNPNAYENVDSITRAHTPVQSGLATLPRKKKATISDNNVNTSSQNRQGSQHGNLPDGHQSSFKESSQKSAANSQYFPTLPYIQSPDGLGLPANMNYNSVSYKNLVNYQNVVQDADTHSRQSSNSSLLSQGTVVECSVGDSHSRQSSSVSQDTLTDKTEKSEKVKETKSKSSKRKEEKRSKLKKEKKDQNSSKPPLGPDRKQTDKQVDEGFHDDRYINRNMVESVLSFQKLQRSGSCVSQTSTSSIESDNSYYLKGRGYVPKDNSSSEIPFDTASLESHKDSGYGSSDRNSSSSTGSITMNPFEQYFLSRSMIPPRYVNEQAVAENMRKLMDQGPGPTGLGYTQEKDLKSLVVNPSEQHNTNVTVGYCHQPQHPSQFPRAHSEPPSQTSTPRDLTGMSKEERHQQIFDALNKKMTPVPPPQVPTKANQGPSGKAVEGPHKVTNPSIDAITGQTGRLPTTTKGAPAGYTETYKPPVEGGHQYSNSFNEVLSCGNEQFLSLCQKAEDFMDQCVLAETSEQFGDALNCCQLAINQLTTAMRLPNVNSTSHSYAQRKSNSCLLKLRSLQKRLMPRPESSTTNSENSHDHRNQRSGAPPSRTQHSQVSHGVKPPSRSSSQNSMDSIKDGNTSSGSGRSSTPVFDARKSSRPPQDARVPPAPPAKIKMPAPPPTDCRVPPTDYHTAYKDRSFETNIPNDNSADLYGTLPRRKTQKSQEHTQSCNNQKHESEIYQDFLDNQRRQNVNHSRTNSGATTPVNENQTFSADLSGKFQADSHSMTTGQAQVRQLQHCGSHGNMRHPAAPHTGIPYVPVSAPEIRQQSQHTEVRKTAVTTVNPAWQQPTGGTTRVANSNTLPRGNIVKGKISTASSAAIQTAYSASVASTCSGQCEPVQPVVGSISGHLTQAASAASNAKSCRNIASESRKLIERSVSFSHIRPPSYSQLFPSHTATKRKLFPCQPSLERSHGTSQPDLRQLSSENLNVKRPSTPQVLCSETTESDSKPVSVRDLASRFESSGISESSSKTTPANIDSQINGVNRSQEYMCEKRTQDGSVNLHCRIVPTISAPDTSSAIGGMHQRQRSKSESEFLASKLSKPKSVLAKKNKSSANKPRKSVTFSANICLVAAMDDWQPLEDDHVTQAGYQSDEEDRMERFRGTHEEEDSSTSADSPIEILGEGACTLCHKKGVQAGQSYCDKCTFYMSRFQPR